jgi:hypothetical protein
MTESKDKLYEAAPNAGQVGSCGFTASWALEAALRKFVFLNPRFCGRLYAEMPEFGQEWIDRQAILIQENYD